MRLPEVGDTFVDRYEITQILGEGAFARVFRARDLQVNREVALKVLSPRQGAYSQLSSARFLRESRLLATLQSPHTVTLFDFGESPSGILWAAFEFVEGRDLAACLRSEGALPAPVVAHILEQALSALQEAHRRTIVHRDLKPANILVHTYRGDPWKVKLLDFGLAKRTSADATQLTGEGKTAGTPRYMSPEQILISEVGPQTDIYSLGLVAYELLTGSPAIDGDNMKELLRGQLDGPPIVVPPELAPQSLCAIIERMCIRALAQRYQNVELVLRDLYRARGELSSGNYRSQPMVGSSAVPVGESEPDTRSVVPELPRQPPPPEQKEGQNRAFIIGAGLAMAAVAVVMIASLLPGSPQAPAVASDPKLPAELTTTREVMDSPPVVPASADLGTDAEVDVGSGAAGCDRGPSGFRHLMVRFGGHEVSVLVYIPASLKPARSPAIIGAFRGNDRTDARPFIEYLGLIEIADEHQAIIVVPNPKLPTFPFGGSWRPEAVEGAWHALVELQAEFCADRGQLFLVGEGRGGEIVDRLICSHGRLITAGATSANRYRLEETMCSPADPVPYLSFEHLKSRLHPVEGGSACRDTKPVVSLAHQISERKHDQGCSDDPPKKVQHTDATCLEYSCETPFVSCQVAGGRHWSGPLPPQYKKLECAGKRTDFPHAKVAWQFFQEHAGAR